MMNKYLVKLASKTMPMNIGSHGGDATTAIAKKQFGATPVTADPKIAHKGIAPPKVKIL